MRLVLTSNNEMGFCEFTNIPTSINPIKDRERGISLEKYYIGDKDHIWGCWDMDISSDEKEQQEQLFGLVRLISDSKSVFKRFSNEGRCRLKNELGTWGVKGIMVSEMIKDYPEEYPDSKITTISEVK